MGLVGPWWGEGAQDQPLGAQACVRAPERPELEGREIRLQASHQPDLEREEQGEIQPQPTPVRRQDISSLGSTNHMY